MKFRDFKYFISQGINGLIANGLMSIASISIVTASIAIFGIFILVGLNLNYISAQAIEQAGIQVFMEFGVGEETIQNIGRQIGHIEGVREVVPLTAEEQLALAMEDFADEPDMLALLEMANPFREGYQIFLRDTYYAAHVERTVGRLDYVATVRNDSEYIQFIEDFARILRMISFWLVLILGIVAIFIISNTIRLAMFSRRREINIMKYVGATNWFIRWPFIVEGMIIGIIGGAIAAGLMLWGYGATVSQLNDLVGIVNMSALGDVWKIMLLSLVALGGGIGLLGSALSVRKYLIV